MSVITFINEKGGIGKTSVCFNVAWELSKKISERYQTKIFETKIRNAVAMSENLISHQGVTDYSPASAVANDIRNLTDEILSGVR